MNYIGSKKTLLPFITESIESIAKNCNVFCDLFAGTGIVGRYFKSKGYKVIANDIQYYAYVLNRHYIGNNKKDISAFEIKDNPLIEGFIYNNYSESGTKDKEHKRIFFSDINAKKCDTIRQYIETLEGGNYFYALASLLECVDKTANTASTYYSFLKKLKPSAQKIFDFVLTDIIDSNKEHLVFNENANLLIEKIETDILYLDPPYNERSYSSYYHLLETIAKYDNPEIRGMSGVRTDCKLSDYSSKRKAFESFSDLIQKAKAKYIFVSYNDEGILSLDQIKSVLESKGKYSVFTKEYKRYKADTNRDYKKDTTVEYLHCCCI